MRANVYSLEALELQTREAIDHGIGMVAAYIGETVVTNNLLTRLPLTDPGLVNPDRVSFSKFDKLVELHVLAVPLVKVGKRVGVSAFDSGISFIDSQIEDPTAVRTVTAHEVAHSLGFVPILASNSDKTNETHCTTSSCIMLPALENVTETIEAETVNHGLRHLLRRRPERQIQRRVSCQYDFCIDCKTNLRVLGQSQLNKLRLGRLAGFKVV